MSWGRVELEAEVRDWLLDLSDEEFGHVAFTSICCRSKVSCSTSRTPSAQGETARALHPGRERRRISYFIPGERRIVLLTIFRKTKMREPGEITRAEMAMRRCIAQGHTTED